MANVTLYYKGQPGTTQTVLPGDVSYWQSQGWTTTPSQAKATINVQPQTASPALVASQTTQQALDAAAARNAAPAAVNQADLTPGIAGIRDENGTLMNWTPLGTGGAGTGMVLKPTDKVTIYGPGGARQDIMASDYGYWRKQGWGVNAPARPSVMNQQQQPQGDDPWAAERARLKTITDSLSTVLQNNLANGNTVNPNLQITPDLVKQFIADSHKAVDPYSQQLLTSEIANVNANLDYLSTQFRNQQAQSAADFQQNLGIERNNAGNAGIAFSGGRGLAEQNMLNAQNRQQANLESAYGRQIGEQLRSGGAAVGNNNHGLQGNVGSFNLPELAGQRASLEGARGSFSGSNPLNYNYDPSLYGIGSLGSAYNENLVNQANQNLSNYQKSAAINTGTSNHTFQTDAQGNLILK